jgi:hypothetical protein
MTLLLWSQQIRGVSRLEESVARVELLDTELAAV